MDKAVRMVCSSYGRFLCFCFCFPKQSKKLCIHYVVVCMFQGMSSVFFNKGENCIAAGRLFVEDSIHDLFVQKVVGVTRSKLYFDFFFLFYSENVMLCFHSTLKISLSPSDVIG